MTLREAVETTLDAIGDRALLVCCNGMVSRETHALHDRPEHFYMLGSMGVASSIGLGLASSRPDRRVVVMDGDGNVLMGLGGLANVGAAAPRNLLHVVFDNGTYGSTGDQATVSDRIPLEGIARAAGYARAERVRTLQDARRAVAELAHCAGPSFLVLEVGRGHTPGIPRVEIEPSEIAGRFRAAAGSDAPVLLNPGPVCVSELVRTALVGPDLCHREPEYFALQRRVRQGLLRALGLDPARHTAVLVGGSGTAAVEAAVTSSVSPGRRLLVVRNGIYGNRIAEMARAHGIDVTELDSSWTSPPDVGELDRRLSADHSIEVVAVVHHETTTGLLNPVPDVARVAREHGARVLVDAVSSLGGDPLPLQDLPIDLCVGTASKCLEGLPGVSFVVAMRDEMARQRHIPARSVYLRLVTHFERQEADDTAFTPPIPALRAFDAALSELASEGLARRHARYASRSSRMRAGFARLGLEPLVPAERSSCSVTTLRLPPGVGYEALRAELRVAGFVIYAGLGDLGRTHFRVATMGRISDQDVDRFLVALDRTLRGIAR